MGAACATCPNRKDVFYISGADLREIAAQMFITSKAHYLAPKIVARLQSLQSSPFFMCSMLTEYVNIFYYINFFSM